MNILNAVFSFIGFFTLKSLFLNTLLINLVKNLHFIMM